MASEFQSSFIPKNPTTQDVFVKKRAGFLGIIVVSLFVFSIIVSIGLFFYKGIIEDDIANLQSQLANAEKNIDKKAINELGVFNKKLKLIQSLVAKHQVVSGFLTSLSSSTVSQVSFTEFNYSNISQGALSVSMKGIAPNYGAVALQEKIFNQNKYWVTSKFSDLGLVEKGLVEFSISVVVDPQIVVYAPLVVELPEPPDELSTSGLDEDIESLDDIDMSVLENL